MDKDKTRIQFKDTPLYKLLWDKLTPKGEEIFLQVRRGNDYDLPARVDLKKNQGPLGAIYSALKHAKNQWVFISAADLPCLDPSIVDELAACRSESSRVVIPRWENGYYEPLVALYRTSLIPVLEKSLEGGTRKVTKFLAQSAGVVEVSIEELISNDRISSECFHNVNKVTDLKQLKSKD